jgi:hypothetical protein
MGVTTLRQFGQIAGGFIAEGLQLLYFLPHNAIP